MKMAFLVPITSARMVIELGAMVVDPSYTIFQKEKVFLRLHPEFLLMIVSEFHTNQAIYLPVFFLKLHASSKYMRLQSLDIRRALAFYL